jgi:hypothetical protein
VILKIEVSRATIEIRKLADRCELVITWSNTFVTI